VVAAFRKGLGETGFVERRNVMVEFRFAYNDNTPGDGSAGGPG
jgi:hypothetical protein